MYTRVSEVIPGTNGIVSKDNLRPMYGGRFLRLRLLFSRISPLDAVLERQARRETSRNVRTERLLISRAVQCVMIEVSLCHPVIRTLTTTRVERWHLNGKKWRVVIRYTGDFVITMLLYLWKQISFLRTTPLRDVCLSIRKTIYSVETRLLLTNDKISYAPIKCASTLLPQFC